MGHRVTRNMRDACGFWAHTRRIGARAFVACCIALAALSAAPAPAGALEVEKLTCRPNGDTGSDVLGGTETRITWEVQADVDEALTALSLTVPRGTTYATDDLRLTMLFGEDLMEREPIDPVVEEDGDTLRLTFPTSPAGRFFRLEVYGVVFPAEGGDLQCEGSYTLSDGTEHEIEGIPAVHITAVTPFEQFKSFLEEQSWVASWNSNTFLRLFFNPVQIGRAHV